MEPRLSESAIKENLDAGHQSLPWDVPQPSGFLAGIDFDAVLASPHAKEIIQSMPIQPLYYGLKRHGFAESAAVLALLDDDQVARVFDFEVWQKDVLDQNRAFGLLMAFAEAGPAVLYDRFSHMDEEYQLSILRSLFRVYDEEEFEKLSEEKKDQLYPMPCNTVFYEILSEDELVIEGVQKLMAAVIEQNLRYAYALINHAAFNPPGEAEALAMQFRKARMEEDGFVSYEESLEVFLPIERQSLVSKWQKRSEEMSLRSGAMTLQNTDEDIFLDKAMLHAGQAGWDVDELFAVHQKLLFLANALCSAAHVEADDIYGLNRVLEHGKALTSLGLEYLCLSDLNLALDILKTEHPKTLFRLGLSLIQDIRNAVVDQLVALKAPGAEQLKLHFLAHKWGNILYDLDGSVREKVGFYNNELLKGLFNRFPMVAKSGDSERVVFAAVASLGSLNKLANQIAAVQAYLQLAVFGSTGKLDQDIDFIAAELLGQRFSLQKLGEANFRISEIAKEIEGLLMSEWPKFVGKSIFADPKLAIAKTVSMIQIVADSMVARG